jgi:hypothetical protein
LFANYALFASVLREKYIVKEERWAYEGQCQ